MATGLSFFAAGSRLLLCLMPALTLAGTGMMPSSQAAIPAHPFLQSANEGPDLPTLWRSAAAVAYMKVQAPLPSPASSAGTVPEDAYPRYRVSVLEVFRRYLGKPEPFTRVALLVPARRPEEVTEAPGTAVLQPGTELVAFMHWNEQAQAFEAFVAVPVRNGQVRSLDVEEISSGASVAFLLKKLRAMME